MNFDQLEESLCHLRPFFKDQKLCLLLKLVSNDLYKEPVSLFYANLRVSKDSGELETLLLGNHIILNYYLFEQVFSSKFFDAIPFMTGCWPDDFEVSLEEAKVAIAEPDFDSLDFGPFSLYFENRILAHIIATSLIPRKVSLSSISKRDVFVLYCLLKKYRIDWASWFHEYIVESVEYKNPNTSVPYGLVISRIIMASMVDLLDYKPVEISSTYDKCAFGSMRCVLVGNKWCKKGSISVKIE